MNRLFIMECKKIGKSVLYWLFVIAVSVTSVRNYDTVVNSELRQTDNPASIFYIAEDGVYAENAGISNEDTQRTMMIGATKRLMSSYRSNSYEYYPFGYVKEKTLSEKEQSIVLSYLQELTGFNEKMINGEYENNATEDFQISGGGAFILNPGQGSMNENGQFIAEPDDWEYVENGSDISKSDENSGNEFEVQVTFERFKEIMNQIDDLIGRNSYFSWTMLTMYYCENDMQDNPITELQHLEFYEKDHVTGAFARYFCDSISLCLLFLPAFVMIDLLLRDKRHRIKALIYPRTKSSAQIICSRFMATICMVMLPVLILPLKSLVTLINYCGDLGIHADIFAFITYTFVWIFPTVLLVVAVALFVTVLTENYFSVLISGLVWLLGKPSIDKIAGGNYGIFALIIRHNTLKGYGRMMENIQILILNRVLISLIAVVFVALTIMIYDAKRKGGIRFEIRKSDNHCK